jgi:ubiquinone biosynthesis protein Coq4
LGESSRKLGACVQVHDLWHVLFDCHTSVLGELALKAVEFVQARAQLRFLLQDCCRAVAICLNRGCTAACSSIDLSMRDA